MLGIFSFLFIKIYINRLKLIYNEEGRCFVAEEGLVFHEQSKCIYGILAVTVTSLFILALIKLTIKIKR